MKTRQPVSLTEDEIAAVRSWVVHEDAHLIAFNKPSGLSSQGGRIQANTLDDLLWAFARSNGKRPELVHRLDRDTSGVILAAKTKPAAGFFGKAMQMRKFQRPIWRWSRPRRSPSPPDHFGPAARRDRPRKLYARRGFRCAGRARRSQRLSHLGF